MEFQNDKNTKAFNFDGLNCMCRVIDITDGDTIKVIINFKKDY